MLILLCSYFSHTPKNANSSKKILQFYLRLWNTLFKRLFDLAGYEVIRPILDDTYIVHANVTDRRKKQVVMESNTIVWNINMFIRVTLAHAIFANRKVGLYCKIWNTSLLWALQNPVAWTILKIDLVTMVTELRTSFGRLLSVWIFLPYIN